MDVTRLPLPFRIAGVALALAIAVAFGLLLVLPNPARGDGAVVIVDRLLLDPSRVEIQAGETVTFQVEGDDDGLLGPMQPLTLVAEDGRFRSPPLEPGSVWRLTLHETGVHRYSLETNPGIEGVIVVE
jgi:plastocyanin